MTTKALALTHTRTSLRAFLALTKPRVVALIVFTALIGALLASPGLPPLITLLAACLGIACVAGAAAALNCLIEQRIDARMARTRHRPLPRGELTTGQALLFALALGGTGLVILQLLVNAATMWLTLASLVGYSIIYTVFLKPATPMNIVIGGAAGAMPPVLGWTAVLGAPSPEAWVLFLIVFVWTPPHFWSLALYRREEYARVGIPMLPVTHGEQFTRLHILLYTVMLAVVALIPIGIGMSGWLYALAALVLNTWFLSHAVMLWREYSDALARRTFRVSIHYLSGTFAALLLDHWLRLAI
jgi:protoheme IX farnesyltransferase